MFFRRHNIDDVLIALEERDARIQAIERLLRQLITQEKPRPSEALLLSKHKAARRLNCRKKEIDRLIREGHLPAVPHGKRVRIPAIAVQQMAETGIPPPRIGGAVPPTKSRKTGAAARRTLADEVNAAKKIRVRDL